MTLSSLSLKGVQTLLSAGVNEAKTIKMLSQA